MTRDDLIETHKDLPTRIARNYRCRSQDDVVGAAMLALVEAAESYDPARGEFEPYAATVIRNACLKEVGRQRQHEGHEAAMAEGLPEQTALPETIATEVAQALGSLSETERAVTLARLEGRTLREIADLIGRSPARAHQIQREAQARLQGETPSEDPQEKNAFEDVEMVRQKESAISERLSRSHRQVLAKRGFAGKDTVFRTVPRIEADLSLVASQATLLSFDLAARSRRPLQPREEAVLLELASHLQTQLGLSPVALLARAAWAEEKLLGRVQKEAPAFATPPLGGLPFQVLLEFISRPAKSTGQVDALWSPTVLLSIATARTMERRDLNPDTLTEIPPLDVLRHAVRVARFHEKSRLEEIAAALEAPARKNSSKLAKRLSDLYAEAYARTIQRELTRANSGEVLSEGLPEELKSRLTAEAAAYARSARSGSLTVRERTALVLYDLENIDPLPQKAAGGRPAHFKEAMKRLSGLEKSFPKRRS